MRKIVVLGCGFGGYHAVRTLESELAGRRRVELTVVTDSAHFVFTPLLYSVASGELDLTHVHVGLSEQFNPRTRLVIDHVERVDLERRELVTRAGTIAFDYLLLAPGAQVDWHDRPEWSEHMLTFCDGRDALRLRERIESAFAQAATLASTEAIGHSLTFVVVGGGATGVELATELFTGICHEKLAEAPPHVREAFRFVLIERNDALLANFPDELRAPAEHYVAGLGLDLRLGREVVDAREGAVALDDGQWLEAGTIVWCGGTRGPAWLAESGFETDAAGRVRVHPTLRVRGRQGIYVIGDAADLEVDTAARAHVAVQQATTAAQNLVANMAGRSKREFVYEHRGEFVSLGRGNAVVAVRNVAVEGKPAWLMYRLFHTAMMPQALKKARLFKDWVATRAHKYEGHPQLLEGMPSSDGPSALEGDDD